MGPYIFWTILFLAICAFPVLVAFPYLPIFFMFFLCGVHLLVRN